MSQETILARCVVCETKCNNRCSRCRSVYYCSSEHQRQDWKRHKTVCVKLPKKLEKDLTEVTADVQKIVDDTVIDNKLKASIANLVHKKEKESPTIVEKESDILGPSEKETCENIDNKVFTENATISCKESDIEKNVISIHNRYKEESITSRPGIVLSDNESTGAGAITYEGSSENEILSESAQQISSTEVSSASVTTSNVLKAVNRTVEATMLAMPGFTVEPPKHVHGRKEYPEASLRGNVAPFCHNKNSFVMDNNDPYFELCQRVIRDMSVYGVCVLDNFLGRERGSLVRNEVLQMHQSGIFQAGQLVSNPASTEARTIRSDKITWIDGKEPHCFYIGNLIQQVDNIVLRANKMPNNGKMGDYVINGRTKAMVACYPGSGSHYVKHVDNPNKDGRCITAIYYLNLDWDVTRSGGLLRVFPEGHHQVADIAPVFDRMLFFWSDRRNPHEVQPAFNTRYAITLWYFDAQEREEATRRFREKQIRAPSTSK